MATRNFFKLISERGPAPAGAAGVFVSVVSGVDTPAAVVANTTSEEAMTVPDAEVGDLVLRVEKPTFQAGLMVGDGRIDAAGVVLVQFTNTTAGNITPTAGETYKFVLLRIA